MSIRITIACPEALIADANQLARCIGYSEADQWTFDAASYEDASGNRYSVPSGLVDPAFLVDALSPLVAPEWGADMEAAARAQALVRLADPEQPETCLAGPAVIVAVVHDDPALARAMMGVVTLLST